MYHIYRSLCQQLSLFWYCAPVINDVTWRIIRVAMLLRKLDGVLIDVECAFLEGELKEEV